MFITNFMLFRIINLVVLAIIIGILIKRKFLGVIKEQIADEEAKLTSLHLQKNEVMRQQAIVKDEISDEQKLMEQLKHNLMVWRTVQKDRLAHELREQHAMAQKLKHTIERQTKERAEQQLKAKVIPQAIAQAKKNLSTQFSNPEEQTAYMDSLFAHLKKGKA